MIFFNIRDLISKDQIDTLAKNVEEFGIDAATHGTARQGIVHMVGPETGRTVNPVNLSSVGIVIRLRTVPLVLLPLVLVHLR